MTAAEIARALRGHKAGAGWMAACPAHTDRTPSLAIKDARDGRVLVRCHAGCAQVDVIDALRLRGLWEHEARDDVARRPVRQLAASTSPQPDDEDGRSADALAIWGEAIHPYNTPVAAHLLRRNVSLPDGAAGEAVRYHPACKFGLKRVPCMVALVRDIRTNEPKAIHRTAIDPKGNQVKFGGNDRMMLGPCGGGAVKLVDDAEITICLGLGEGIETTLSMRRFPEFGASPVWAVLSAGQISAFPVLPGVECLWIAVDRDSSGTGQRCSLECSRRWVAAGREVYRVVPDVTGDDVNDLVRGVRA
jgi:putative DNA primase/helicase